MHYLSNHDLTWINATLLGKSVPFNYEALESAMAAQYSYGDSTLVQEQAGNLLGSFVKSPPFAAGNRRTAFVALLTYLAANGYELTASADDTSALVNDVFERRIDSDSAIAKCVGKSAGAPSTASLRSVVTSILNSNSSAISSLTPGDE